MAENKPARDAGRKIPRQRKPSSEETTNETLPLKAKRANRTETAIAKAIAICVSKAPPLGPETKARLAELLSAANHQVKKK